MHVCGVCFTLDDVEDTHVAARLAGVDGDHAVLGLEETTHDVQNGCLADCLGLLDVVACEWGVRSDEEVGAWCGDQRGNDSCQVIVHVAWVSESSG